ncbi:hypothetical protein PHET_10033 [Paragonimus heterotremus]|uniref:Peptidase S1 domain-containing protein n=1 Tax=Paragonimus heterotremus TaxID=100268 RepID=A0A8J4WE42_9TREM|nr:hypothetical protein PHET_10033 [Paragonimus heterotremus]
MFLLNIVRLRGFQPHNIASALLALLLLGLLQNIFRHQNDMSVLSPVVYRGYQIRRTAGGLINAVTPTTEVHSKDTNTTALTDLPSVKTVAPEERKLSPSIPDLLKLNQVEIPRSLLHYVTARLVAILQVDPPFARRPRRKRHICGGTAISSIWILTAAHCVAHAHRFHTFLRVATFSAVNLNDLEDIFDFSTKQRYFRVDRVIIHPNFRFGSILSDDIALLRIEMEKPLPWRRYAVVKEFLDDYIMNPTDRNNPIVQIHGMPCLIAGAGRLTYRQSHTVEHDAYNEYLHVAVVSISSCTRLSQRLNWQPKTEANQQLFLHTHICAGGQTDDGDMCQGDSGGPLICADQGSQDIETGQFHQVCSNREQTVYRISERGFQLLYKKMPDAM